MIYLTTAEIVEIHNDILLESGGTAGILFEGLLGSCAERPARYVYGLDLYPDIFMKAAALMYCIIFFHPFVDGNKRTGLMAASVFLELNGYVVVLEKGEAIKFTIEIANGNVQEREIAEWLRKHSVSAVAS